MMKRSTRYGRASNLRLPGRYTMPEGFDRSVTFPNKATCGLFMTLHDDYAPPGQWQPVHMCTRPLICLRGIICYLCASCRAAQVATLFRAEAVSFWGARSLACTAGALEFVEIEHLLGAGSDCLRDKYMLTLGIDGLHGWRSLLRLHMMIEKECEEDPYWNDCG